MFGVCLVCVCTDLVVEFRQVQLHFVSLEVVILGLLTHRRNQVELPGDRVRLLMHTQVRCTGETRR